MAEPAAEKQARAAAVYYTLFAAVVAAAFLFYRGDDIGRLPWLFENLNGGPLLGAAILDSIVGLSAAVLIAIAWFGVGSFIVRVLDADDRIGLWVAIPIRLAVGSGILSLAWFFIGLANGYTTISAVVALVTGIALAAKYGRSLGGRNGDTDNEGTISFGAVMTAITVAVLLLTLMAALAPPTAKDTLLYHFALPKAFIAQGSNGFVEGNIASYLSLGIEMHVVWAMLLGNVVGPRAGEAASGATVFLYFPLLLSAVYGWAKELGLGRAWAIAAAAMVATIPTAYHVASSGYVDVALALHITLAVYALGKWWNKLDNRNIALVAIFLGAALAIKLTAVFVFAAFALVILIRGRSAVHGGRLVARGILGLLFGCVLASPWYLRTWLATGSPFFPFYLSLWEGRASGWDVERSNLFQAMNSQYGGDPKTVLDYLLAPVNVSIVAQPELASHFDGVLGIAFLIGLPLLGWGLWKLNLPVEAKIPSAISVVVFLFWLFSSQQLRYLLPIAPLLAVAIAAAADRVSAETGVLRRAIGWSFSGAAALGLLTVTAWFMQRAPVRVVFGGETRDSYLARNLDHYPFYQELQKVSDPAAKVWLINMRRDTYHLDRPVFSDYLFEDWTLREMIWQSRNANELRASIKAKGLDYVLARHDFLLDPQLSTLIDDRRPRIENDAKLALARSLVLDPERTIKADKKFSLVKIDDHGVK